MNVFNLRTFVLDRPIELCAEGTFTTYQASRSGRYKPNSVIWRPPYSPQPSNKRKIEIRRKDVRARPYGVVMKVALRERLGTIELKACEVTTKRGYFISTIKEVKGMAKFRKKQVSWEAVDSPDVAGYKLYWAVDGGVNYESEFAEVGRVTDVILPDDVPSFPLIEGDIEIGVTAVSERGNESDMTVFSAPFDFTAPPAPENLIVRDL